MFYRRAHTLVGYWHTDRFGLKNYARGTWLEMRAADLRVLEALSEWGSVEDVAASVRPPLTTRRLRAIVARLAAAHMVEVSTDPPHPVERGLEEWQGWLPSAGFFHFDTKDTAYAAPAVSAKALRKQLLVQPAPAPPPPVWGDPLPSPQRRGALAATLRARRSWRRFGTAQMPLQSLATLLNLTWGVQRWAHTPDQTFALKTSPSGGACHSLDVWVVAQTVAGVRPGLYRYQAETHTLVHAGPAWTRQQIIRRFAHQPWFGDTSAMLIMTTRFDRVQWKYPFARAYRTILLEAGHVGQTCCLVATSLGLASCCTAAFADSRIEKALGIDGVTESAVYAIGVGTRPAGVRWAPWPSANDTPPTSSPRRRRPPHAPHS